jgi:hypothetical protein
LALQQLAHQAFGCLGIAAAFFLAADQKVSQRHHQSVSKTEIFIFE